MSWTDTLAFILGYLLTPALAIGTAALVIHLILLIKNYRTERALRADSLTPSAVQHAALMSRFIERFSEASDSPGQDYLAPKTCQKKTRCWFKSKKCKANTISDCEKSDGRGIRAAILRQRSKRVSNATVAAYEQRRSIAKHKIEQYNRTKKARRMHERNQKQNGKLSGIMWGFDPLAGQISQATPASMGASGCYIFRAARNDSDQYGVEEIDTLGRRTGRCWLPGSKWGLEMGGPGKEPHFGASDVRQLPAIDSAGTSTRNRSQRSAHHPQLRLRPPQT